MNTNWSTYLHSFTPS